MARMGCVRRERHTCRPDRSAEPSGGRKLETLLVGLATLFLALALGGTTPCAAASGLGAAMKVGAQTMENPVDRGKTTRLRIEMEAAGPLFFHEHLDLALMVGGSPLGSITNGHAHPDEESYVDHVSLLDLRLAARLYPLGASQPLRPYLGAGLGYFWLLDMWHSGERETYTDSEGDTTIHYEDEGTDTLAHGLFPFGLAGLALVAGSAELLLELQYDLDKADGRRDLSGPTYLFGGRIRF